MHERTHAQISLVVQAGFTYPTQVWLHINFLNALLMAPRKRGGNAAEICHQLSVVFIVKSFQTFKYNEYPLNTGNT